jgi:hypothetical protein
MSLPQVAVDVGFTSTAATGVFTVGHPTLGAIGSYPIGATDIWTDVTQYVRSWSVKRGAGQGDSPTLRYDPGTAVIEFNDGFRYFDPENLAGPFVTAGVTQVEAMRRVRVRAVWNGVTYPIFYGYADDWKPSYQGSSWTYTMLPATDGSVLLSSDNREALLSPVGVGEDSGARVTRILDAYGWPSTDRVISTGDTTLQATDMAGASLTELQLVQDTEQGEFYIDAQNRAVFRHRRAALTEARSTTAQATFGDGGYLATGEIPYADATMSTPGDTLVNTVSATNAGGVEQVVTDAVSASRYTTKSHARSDLLGQTDDTALQWAHWLAYQYSTPRRRFARLEFNTPDPGVQSVFWPAMLGRDFGDRITVVRRPAGGGTAITRDCFVRGVEHSSNGVEWTSAFTLQGADRYSFFVVGDPILGRVGYNAVAW